MEEYNPWWKMEEDEVYIEWKESEIKWTPEIIHEICLRPFSLNFLVGPRQIGKTTALKILIHTLLRKINPKGIFYYSCDELTDYIELGEVIDNYLSSKKAWNVKNSFIFLDEITFVSEWERAIKARIDKKRFKQDVLVITGSTSIEILKQRERFPGRRGYGKDVFFHPLDFGEFVKIFGKLKLKSSCLKNIGRVRKAMHANALFSGTISSLFNEYLETGGFPLAIREWYTQGKISVSCLKTHLDWLRGDWIKVGKNDKYMKELLSYILSARNSPVSWLGIAKETSINSPHTVVSYVDTLKNLFAIKALNLLLPDGKIAYRKNKKVHVTDPFLYKVMSYFTKKPAEAEVVKESVVATHISRVLETYFWRNKTEVDIVVPLAKKQVGFEVKSGVEAWRKPYHLKDAFLLDKKTLPLFLASTKWK